MTETTPAREQAALSLGERLLETAVGLRERAAVTALIEEEHLLTQKSVRRLLVWEPGDGTAHCAWERLAANLFDDEILNDGFAFLHLLLSITGIGHQTSLIRVMDLDERRLAIILRAMIRLSGCDTLAVDART